MGLFSFLGGLVGAGKAKKASRRAETAQLEYLGKALDEQRRQYDLTRSDYGPALSLLAPSVQALGDYAGLNGDEAMRSRMTALESSPLLSSLIREGEEGILQNAAATGGLRGGNTQNSLADFRADAFNTVLQQQLAQLGQTAGIGLGSTDSASTFGANSANQIANLYGQQGQVRAGGLLTRGGINNQMWNNAGAFADNIGQMAAGGGAGPFAFLSKLF